MRVLIFSLTILFNLTNVCSQNLQELWVGDDGYYLRLGKEDSHHISFEYFTDYECKSANRRYQYFLIGDTLRIEDKYSKMLAQKRKVDWKIQFAFLIETKTNEKLRLIPLDTTSLLTFRPKKILNYSRRSEVRTDTLKFEKLLFSSSNCFGHSPSMAIEIDNERKVKFVGGKYAVKQGFFTSMLSDKLYSELINLLQISELDKLKNNNQKAEDAPIYTLEIYYNQKHKVLKSYKLPLVTDELLKYLMNISKEVDLKEAEHVQITFSE